MKKKERKKEKKKASRSPVPSLVLTTAHTQHSGPDSLQYPSEAALLQEPPEADGECDLSVGNPES